MQQVLRYHPLLVTLHWLLAILIIAALFVGYFLLASMPNANPEKIRILMAHMSVGMLILALTIIRFVVRMLTSRPQAATTGYPMLDRLAPVTHYGFYVLILLMVGSGYATAILAGLNRIVFQKSGEPLPPSFDVYPSFIAHGAIAALLAAFITLHVLAALYHQFIRKDRLFRRMFFGRRAVTSPADR
ncbi:MAG TPA: cytochrome b/b6 domain-containing protein [Xanthobacteraceae bacterium]|nr:cytochrome b/b6 domain-containing protein [Xanthobacteraceae bacterium]